MSTLQKSFSLSVWVALAVSLGGVAQGLPELTDPTFFSNPNSTYNLGVTGTRGWIFGENVGSWAFVPWTLTTQSRQIRITAVEAGSPADGVLQINDVISGIGATVFESDARKVLGFAIGAAEAGNGQLKLKVWRKGVTTDNVTLQLPVLKAYSATAPFDCQKSAMILAKACAYLAEKGIKSGGETVGQSLIALALLASGNTNYIPLVRAHARAIEGPGSTSAWHRGYNLVVLCEYYLATGDAEVLPAITSISLASAQGMSWVGTYGHGMADTKIDGSFHGGVPPYGALNQAGQTVVVGLILAEKAITKSGKTVDPEIHAAIARATKYFAYFSGKGAVPYGESPPEELNDDNGKNGLAAVIMALQGRADMSAEARYFAKTCTAGYSVREFGHPNPFWAQVWQPMGVAVGGDGAVVAYFKKIQWELDLCRRADGSLVWNESCGPDSSGLGGTSDTAKVALTYALGLKRLYITGKTVNPANRVNDAEVAEAIKDGEWLLKTNMKKWTIEQLVEALSSWSAQTRDYAVDELLTRPEVGALVPRLMVMAEGKDVNLRAGATKALALFKDTQALPVLVRRLSDKDFNVRWMATGGYDREKALLQKPEAKPVLEEMLKLIVSQHLPVEPIGWSDPCQVAQGNLQLAAFKQLRNSVADVPTELLYPAIAATTKSVGATALIDFFKGNALSDKHIQDLAPVLTSTLISRAQYWDIWTPQAVVTLLSNYKYEEGIAAAMMFHNIYVEAYAKPGRSWWYWGGPQHSLAALQKYGAAARETLPELRFWNTNSVWCGPINLKPGAIQPTIDVIQNACNATTPPPAMKYFKTIQSVSATPAVFTKPTAVTRLKTSASTLSGDTLAYSWRKLRGAGTVTFSPNGTSGSSNTTATFSTPGAYVLQLTVFNATLNLYTNVASFNGYGAGQPYGGVTTNLTVVFKDSFQKMNRPPAAVQQKLVFAENTVQPITLAGSDPEGYEVTYALSSFPTNGIITGEVPNLTYTPRNYFYGKDSFDFVVTDSEGQRSAGRVSMDITHVNHAPTALNRSMPILRNTATTFELSGSDADAGDRLVCTVLTRPQHGTLFGTSPKLMYKPTALYKGLDSFTFKVNDGKLDSTNSATVYLMVGAVAPKVFSEFFQNPDRKNKENAQFTALAGGHGIWLALYTNLVCGVTRLDDELSMPSDRFPKDYTDWFNSRHTGYINCPTNGNYIFDVSADDSIVLWVDETLVAMHPGIMNPSKPRYLTSGYHSFRAEYLEYGGDQHFSVYWSGPGFGRQKIPANLLFHSPRTEKNMK